MHQGTIRWIGHSTFPASEIVEALVTGMGVIPYVRWVGSGCRVVIARAPTCTAGVSRALDVELSDDVLDSIDQNVPSRTTINEADNGWAARALQPVYRRR